MLNESLLLSKIIDDKEYVKAIELGLKESDFVKYKDTFQFISNYINNYNDYPSYKAVVNETGFDYQPEVTENIEYLVKAIKNDVAKRYIYKVLQEKASIKFNDLKGLDFVNWLEKEINYIKEETEVKDRDGSNFATNGRERQDLYYDSKENKEKHYIPTPYPTLTDKLCGGFELGDYVLLQAFTNRGKSFIASHIGVTAWKAGFMVLHYSPELSKKQQLARLDTMLANYNNVGIRKGNLSNESDFISYLKDFNKYLNKVDYIVKTMEDMDSFDIHLIKKDLLKYKDVKLVIIDGFNLLAHKGKDNTRNNMSMTSRKLRQLFGRHKIVGLVVHQTPASAEKENNLENEYGEKVPNPAKLHQFSETIAVVQDASTVLSYDYVNKKGKLLISKARNACVGEEINLSVDYTNGYIEESWDEEKWEF